MHLCWAFTVRRKKRKHGSAGLSVGNCIRILLSFHIVVRYLDDSLGEGPLIIDTDGEELRWIGHVVKTVLNACK